jgi:4-alpha-glucanotransferase
MTISPLAGKPAPKQLLVDVPRLEREYYERVPNMDDPSQLVSFGTSGQAGEAPDVARQLIDVAWSSPAAVAIAPLQDVLNLGCEARMNVPGRPDDNWKWRATEEMLCGSAFEFLLDLTTATNRRAPSQQEKERLTVNC